MNKYIETVGIPIFTLTIIYFVHKLLVPHFQGSQAIPFIISMESGVISVIIGCYLVCEIFNKSHITINNLLIALGISSSIIVASNIFIETKWSSAEPLVKLPNPPSTSSQAKVNANLKAAEEEYLRLQKRHEKLNK
jgi:hypothetical protein